MSTETGQVTGTKDKTYNLLWFTEQCLENALRLETYVQDAEREATTSSPTYSARLKQTARRAPKKASVYWRSGLSSGRSLGRRPDPPPPASTRRRSLRTAADDGHTAPR